MPDDSGQWVRRESAYSFDDDLAATAVVTPGTPQGQEEPKARSPLPPVNSRGLLETPGETPSKASRASSSPSKYSDPSSSLSPGSSPEGLLPRLAELEMFAFG